MSTTVNYKGNTITTLSNETKTLTTAGTWVEGDISITDNSVDMPVFTITWNQNYEMVSSSCSETFAQCYARYNNNDTSAYYHGIFDIDAESWDGYRSLVVRSADTNSIVYTYFYGATPGDDIIYNSNGQINFVSPSTSGLTLNATENGVYVPTDGVYTDVIVNVPSSSPSLQAKTNINPTTSSQTITADSGYDGLSSVQINAMPTGSAGTPSAVKGTVSNHSISVTPSVTNTTGYITGGTNTGTTVTVSASELVSGAINIDNDGTYDVTNYAEANVAIDYESKVRAITFIVNRNSDDTTVARVITVYQTFGSQINFSDGIKTIASAMSISVGDITKTTTLYIPKSRPIIVIGAAAAIGNFDVIIDSSYGECVDVPHILGASNTHYTKAVYLKTNAPDEFTVTINLNSQATYSDTVLLNSLSVTSNGTYTATSGTAYSSVNVEVEPNLQVKTNINPTTSSQTITADSGYDGLSSVQINAMPTMTLPTSASSSSSGTSKATIGRSTSAQYINIPTGYNGTASYYTISATPNGSATTPATTITANPTITVSSSGLITATASASQNITPTVSVGYISSGTAGTVTVSGSKTQQLTTKGATTYNTSTTDQTVASGTYLTGTQTIKAVIVSGLDASKILSGTTVMVGDANDADRIASATGTVTFSTITTSSSNPTGGNNGDVWIKTS